MTIRSITAWVPYVAIPMRQNAEATNLPGFVLANQRYAHVAMDTTVRNRLSPNGGLT